MSRRSTYLMWADACELLDRADRMQRQFFHPATAAQPTWEPPVDVFAADDGFWITVALPGVAAADLALGFDGADLVVSGHRHLPDEAAGLAIRRMEIPAGRFERRIALPPGRYQVLERRLADGCLTLVLRVAA